MSKRELLGERRVTAVNGETQASCQARWFLEAEPHAYSVEVGGPWGTVTGRGNDLFGSLVDARLQLEASGWLLAVQGARRDTYPSGMLRDFGGNQVYVLERGKPAREKARTFADAPIDMVATVADQENAYHEWLASV